MERATGIRRNNSLSFNMDKKADYHYYDYHDYNYHDYDYHDYDYHDYVTMITMIVIVTVINTFKQ